MASTTLKPLFQNGIRMLSKEAYNSADHSLKNMLYLIERYIPDWTSKSWVVSFLPQYPASDGWILDINGSNSTAFNLNTGVSETFSYAKLIFNVSTHGEDPATTYLPIGSTVELPSYTPPQDMMHTAWLDQSNRRYESSFQITENLTLRPNSVYNLRAMVPNGTVMIRKKKLWIKHNSEWNEIPIPTTTSPYKATGIVLIQRGKTDEVYIDRRDVEVGSVEYYNGKISSTATSGNFRWYKYTPSTKTLDTSASSITMSGQYDYIFADMNYLNLYVRDRHFINSDGSWDDYGFDVSTDRAEETPAFIFPDGCAVTTGGTRASSSYSSSSKWNRWMMLFIYDGAALKDECDEIISSGSWWLFNVGRTGNETDYQNKGSNRLYNRQVEFSPRTDGITVS